MTCHKTSNFFTHFAQSLVIFCFFVSFLMCWEKFKCILVKILLMNIAIKQFILKVFNFKFSFTHFFRLYLLLQNLLVTIFYKIEIKLWLIIMWDFQLIWIQFWFGIFFRFFPIIFVIQNIRAQSLPNHKHFEVYYSYKKACRVSIWRPIYRLIVDTLLQLFMKK